MDPTLGRVFEAPKVLTEMVVLAHCAGKQKKRSVLSEVYRLNKGARNSCRYGNTINQSADGSIHLRNSHSSQLAYEQAGGPADTRILKK